MRDFIPTQGMIVKHFKGGHYEVLGIAKHTETSESLVTYQSLKTGEIFARPLVMFCSSVDKEKYPNVEQEYRLEEVFDYKVKANRIVENFDKLVALAANNKTPVYYNARQKQNLVLYFNEDYNKIFIDKSAISGGK